MSISTLVNITLFFTGKTYNTHTAELLYRVCCLPFIQLIIRWKVFNISLWKTRTGNYSK